MPEPSVPWWKRTTVYQIYPRSFYDSNGDGIGDLQGIIEKLDYVKELGFETIWFSPFTMSPQADFGYDISDYLSIAPEYGTMEECERLIEEVHARDMRIVLDMVLNHTSDQHPWFQESRSSRDNPRRDWYIWRDGRGPRTPPNNWKAMIGGSGWHKDDATEQWYWATFLPFQPDLNYRNPDVKEAMFGIVRHWLKQGVDGFRLDIFNAIYKDASFQNNPFSRRPLPSEENPDGFFQKNENTINHPDTFAFAKELRQVVDEFDDPERFVVGEVFGSTEDVRRYCGDQDGLHMVFLFKSLQTPCTAKGYSALIQDYERHFPEPAIPTLVFGNHDRPRRSKTEAQARLQATFQLTARGVPFVYYGEEIGMQHRPIPLAQAKDPIATQYRWVPQWVANWITRKGILLNRDECRTPMQWDSSQNAGFSVETPWLPVHEDFPNRNVQQQEKGNSLLNCYKALLKLLKEHPVLQYGAMEWKPINKEHPKVLHFVRTSADRMQSIDVMLNFGKHAVPLAHASKTRILFSTLAPEQGTVDAPKQLAPFEGIVLYVSH